MGKQKRAEGPRQGFGGGLEAGSEEKPADRRGAAAEMKSSNRAISGKLREYADLLEQQGADGFRERAYRRAADTVAALDVPLRDILEKEGNDGLVALPTIGRGIASAIAEMLVTGHWTQLERLRGEMIPARLFQTVPGIGPKLAEYLADELHLETLHDLEAVIENTEVELRGFGPRRREAVGAILASRLGRPMPIARAQFERPPAEMLLAVDESYRQKAGAGALRLIAPRRFNPTGAKWMPIMHARRGEWHFTVLFSNTRLAHELGKTGDWVVAYHEKEGQMEGRSTIVTETKGPLKGLRVVRGMEEECARYHSQRGKERNAG